MEVIMLIVGQLEMIFSSNEFLQVFIHAIEKFKEELALFVFQIKEAVLGFFSCQHGVILDAIH